MACYNIHNIVKIKSDVKLFELEFFLVSNDFPDDSADIIVRVVNSLELSSLHLRRKLIADKDVEMCRVRYEEHLGALGAQFAINFVGRRGVEILVNKLISTSRHVLYVNLVEPMLRFVIISKGYVLLHSACMDLHGHGFLLSAPPDTGKTTTVIKCTKNGFSFLSDDMTIIQLPNEAICFPKPMTISAHTFKTAASVSNSSDTGSKGGLKIRSLVHSKQGRQFMRKLGRYNVPIFTINTVGQTMIRPPKFRIEDLLHDIKIRARTEVRALYFLEKDASDHADDGQTTRIIGEGNQIQAIPLDTALRKAIENSDDAFLFPPYKELLEYISINGESAQELLAKERVTLEKFLSNISCSAIRSKDRTWYQTLMTIACNTIA